MTMTNRSQLVRRLVVEPPSIGAPSTPGPRNGVGAPTLTVSRPHFFRSTAWPPCARRVPSAGNRQSGTTLKPVDIIFPPQPGISDL